jgi:hypothetical protein
MIWPACSVCRPGVGGRLEDEVLVAEEGHGSHRRLDIRRDVASSFEGAGGGRPSTSPPGIERPWLATLPTVTLRYSTGLLSATAVDEAGARAVTTTYLVNATTERGEDQNDHCDQQGDDEDCPTRRGAGLAPGVRSTGRRRGPYGSAGWLRASSSADAHGVETPQKRSVINMSETEMATTLARMARPVARPTPSGPPVAL